MCNTFRNIAAKRVENVRSNRLFLVNKHFVRSLRATISCEYFKLRIHLLSSYEFFVNLPVYLVTLMC